MPTLTARRSAILKLADSLRVTDTPVHNRFTPTPVQRAFMALPWHSALWAGKVAGSKTWGLCFAAAQYIDKPHYGALLIGRTERALKQKGGLIDTLQQMYPSVSIVDRFQRFPSGASIQFGTLNDANEHLKFQGGNWQFIGIDEASNIGQAQLQFMPSRLRRAPTDDIPLRYRLCANPGGVSTGYLRRTFVESPNEPCAANEYEPRYWMPSDYKDNPYIDAAAYEKSFAMMSELDRQRFQYGNWDARADGMLDTSLLLEHSGDIEFARTIRAYDLAATPGSENANADYSVGALVGVAANEAVGGWNFYIESIDRFRLDWAGVTKRMQSIAAQDGLTTEIRFEQERGGSGKAWAQMLQREVLRDYNALPILATGSKVERAKVLAQAIGEGRVSVRRSMRGRRDLIEEMQGFPDDTDHDDQVDALSLAISELHKTFPERWLSLT